MKKLIAIIISIFLIACGESKMPGANPRNTPKTLDGTYVSAVNGRSLTFKPNGLVYEISGKNKFDEMHYIIEDSGKIKLNGADVLQLSLMKNGSIGSLSYGEMVKQ